MSVGPTLAGASRVAAAVIGSLVLTLVASVCLALWVPASRTLGTALGVTLAIPLWVTTMCPGFLAKSAWKPWVAYLGSAGGLALLTWLAS